MKRTLRKLFIWSPFFILLLYIFDTQTANSHSSQPDAGHVKDPVNNQSCARVGCHSSFPSVNASRANVTIGTTLGNQVPLSGFQYSTGTQYIIQFSITSTAARYGFEMSALTSTNTNAGTFSTALSPATTTLGTLSGISYMGHKNANTTNSWNFNWTSPATNVGNITFYSAVNKSNNSNNSLGDSIFHQTYVITAPTLVANAGNNRTVCPNTTTALQASATNAGTTSTYAWSPSTGLSCTTCANPTATITGNISYTVTVTSAGQTAADAVTINTFSTTDPTISTTANTVCPGSSVTLSSSGFSSYLWSTGSNTSTAVVNAGGTYNLTATDANGCSTSNSIVIQQGQSATPVISSSEPFLCGGNSATLSAGSFSDYVWSNNATTSSINATSAGNYNVTVTNASGCSASASFNLLAYPLPTAAVSASGPLAFCSGENVTLTANAGTGNTYKWSTGATTAAITVSQSGSYKVTVYNPCDSAVSQTQPVVVNTVPVAQLSPSAPVLLCNGATQTFHASPSGLSYTWLKDGLPVSGETADSLVVNSAGSYSAVVSNGNCSDTSQAVSVSTGGTGNAVVNIVASQNYSCTGEVITLDAGAGFSTYSWTPVSSASQTAQVSNAGTYIVSVTVNNGQCNSTGADTITIAAGTNVSVPALWYDSTACAGDTVTITVSPTTFTSYSWSNGGNSSSIEDITGTYTVTVSQSGFCGTASATINANGLPLPDASFTVANSVLTANTIGGSYQWYLDGSPITGATTETYTAVETGSYTLEVVENGCVNVSAPQQVVINGIDILSEGFSATFYPNPFNEVLKFVIEASGETELMMEMRSMDGRIILSQKSLPLSGGTLLFEENVSALPDGIYLLFLRSGNFSRCGKVLKQSK